MQLSPAENIGDRIAKALQNIESRVPLYLGRTLGLLRKLGMPDLPMGNLDKNLRKVVYEHPDVPKDVLRAIADPVAVYRDRSPSATHGTLRVVPVHHASDGRPIFVSVRPNSTLAQVRANEVPTIYAPKRNQIAGKMLNTDLLYVNNKKAPAFMRKVPATSVPGAALRPAPGRSVLTDRGVGKALRRRSSARIHGLRTPAWCRCACRAWRRWPR